MIVNSVISAFYYLNVSRLMYFSPPADPAPLATNRALKGVLAVAAIATLLLFLCAEPFFQLSHAAAQTSTLLPHIPLYPVR